VPGIATSVADELANDAFNVCVPTPNNDVVFVGVAAATDTLALNELAWFVSVHGAPVPNVHPFTLAGVNPMFVIGTGAVECAATVNVLLGPVPGPNTTVPRFCVPLGVNTNGGLGTPTTPAAFPHSAVNVVGKPGITNVGFVPIKFAWLVFNVVPIPGTPIPCHHPKNVMYGTDPDANGTCTPTSRGPLSVWPLGLGFCAGWLFTVNCAKFGVIYILIVVPISVISISCSLVVNPCAVATSKSFTFAGVTLNVNIPVPGFGVACGTPANVNVAVSTNGFPAAVLRTSTIVAFITSTRAVIVVCAPCVVVALIVTSCTPTGKPAFGLIVKLLPTPGANVVTGNCCTIVQFPAPGPSNTTVIPVCCAVPVFVTATGVAAGNAYPTTNIPKSTNDGLIVMWFVMLYIANTSK